MSACETADIDLIAQIAGAEFGELAATREREQWLFDLDRQAYQKIADRNGAILGFYCLFRLSRLGAKAAARGDFDITNCPAEFFRNDAKDKKVPIYVGGIYAEGRKAQAMARGALNVELLKRAPTRIFPKAATEDGLRLLRQWKFEPARRDRTGIGELYMR